MKQIMIGLASVAGICLYAGVATSDPGGYTPPGAGAGGMSLPTLGELAGPNTLFGSGDLPPGGRGPDRYGLHPCIKKFFHIPTAGCAGGNGYGYGANGHNPLANPANWGPAGYGMGGPALGQNPFPPGVYGPAGCLGGQFPGGPNGMAGPYAPQNPAMMQGTLVFPHNSFIRSPRDYFMMDLNK